MQLSAGAALVAKEAEAATGLVLAAEKVAAEEAAGAAAARC